ncbi:unnamed protein product [Rotaria sp. Silwood1]|nr:unnamed protein product [Rotaria sp. Silwood1]CAF3432445.1 unnamed protein product [Rotaria sp. Silwood1]
MYCLNILFIVLYLLPNISCSIDKNFIQKQNNVMKEFFSICIALIIIGFIIGTILLIIILPFIVDPIVVDEDQESINSSDESQTKEQKLKIESDDSLSLIDDDDDDDDDDDKNIIEQDIDEISSF